MIRKVCFKNYRNIKDIVFEFDSEGHVVVFGENNQGKSNFLEGIYVVSHGDTPMHHALESVVNIESDTAVLGLDFERENEIQRLYIKILKNGKKSYQYNQREIKTLKTLKNDLLVEFLSADVLRLLQDEPECRRKELDNFCSLLFGEYGDALSDYGRILKQKNYSLKHSEGLHYLDVWNRQLSSLAERIVTMRLMALEKINFNICEMAEELSLFFSGNVNVSYSVSRLKEWENGYGKAMYDQMNRDHEKEKLLGYSLSGPQKDDFLIRVSNQVIQQYYSRGINRMTALLFKIGQWKELESMSGKFPMLLLDDAFSELDKNNRGNLIRYLTKKTKIIYATVQEDDYEFFDLVRVFRMSGGVLNGIR